MLSPGLLHYVNSLGDCNTEKELIHLVNISFKKKTGRKSKLTQLESLG